MPLELKTYDPLGIRRWRSLARFGFSVVVLLPPTGLHGDKMKYGFSRPLPIAGKRVEAGDVGVREPGDRAVISHGSTT